ncbi:MAG: TIGR00282 family metallophosphoesterase [Clostridiales bacterium]|nr:TIGR00282 family metallophosphoesterase [Clostridiales bacterium]
MNILVIGDVVGKAGCDFLRTHLPSFKKLKNIDLCIANGENSAPGNGITSQSAEHLFSSGVDFITSGNHAFNKNEVGELLDRRQDVIRPANYCDECPGSGFGIIDMGYTKIGVLNLLGNAFISDNVENSFICAERMLPLLAECKTILVDLHAEATGEKRAMGFFLDGKVTALFGSHTHVLTADEQILPKGTAYITDIGMTGPKNSVLGVKPEIVIRRLKTGMPARFDIAEGACMMNGCIISVDIKSGKATGIERVCIE